MKKKVGIAKVSVVVENKDRIVITAMIITITTASDDEL